MPSAVGQFKVHHWSPRTGINLQLPHHGPLPTRCLDAVNCVITPGGIVGGPGWAALGNEILTANGGIRTLGGFALSTESNFTFCVTTTQFNELVSGTWTERQDANNLSYNTNAHPRFVQWNDILYIAVPATGTANALMQWTGTGDITRVSGSPRNAGGIELAGNRLLTALTYDADGTLRSTRVYRSGDGAPTSWAGADFFDFTQSPSPVMRILRLGQELMVYKLDSVALMHLTSSDATPFEPDEIPGNVGLALPDAIARGGAYHFWMGQEDVYLMRGGEYPEAIGEPITELLHDNFGTGSFVLAGYDRRSPQREGFFLLTNVANAAGDAGPNSPALTYMYLHYDITSRQWTRGELTNIPRAFGNYYPRFGFIDAAPIVSEAALIGLDSTNGSTAYELNYATANRAGSAFTREFWSETFDLGDPFATKLISDVWPIVKRRSTGIISLGIYKSDSPNAVPALVGSALSFALDGTASIRQANAKGRVFQFRGFATNDFDCAGFAFRAGVVG